jgi:cystathionine beta-lyase
MSDLMAKAAGAGSGAGAGASFNFDEPVERRGTSCAKWDMHARRGKPVDLLPLWVADMDFRIPQQAVDAICERAQHAVFGYTDPSDGYYAAVCNWFSTYHNWDFTPDEITVTPGVCFALAQAVQAFTQPGDTVLIQPPVYYPFRLIVRENGRNVANAPLTYNAECAQASAAAAAANPGAQPEHPYSIDFDAFERTIVETGAKLFLLCNPHNPVGRVWTPAELNRMGEICAAHGVIVVADEIHADFARPGFTHTPFATLGDTFAQNCVVCTAPSKTFNLAGLQVSNIVVPNPHLRAKFRATCQATGFDNINALGMVAAQACYESGRPWLDALKAYLEGNLAFMNQFLAAELPAVTLVQPQSTYLTWLDCTGLGISHDELRQRVEQDAKLWLDHGAMFGPEGVGFLRFNNATQRATLEQALKQLASAFK